MGVRPHAASAHARASRRAKWTALGFFIEAAPKGKFCGRRATSSHTSNGVRNWLRLSTIAQ
jgi:hypothetical protein